MNNNKNRTRDKEKNNPELRKLQPKDNSNIGIIEGRKIGVHKTKHEK